MTKTNYEQDFYAWTQAQAAALRAKDWAALDVENLAEEIASLGRSDRRVIESQLVRLLHHLLKWAYQPQGRGSRAPGAWSSCRIWTSCRRRRRTRDEAPDCPSAAADTHQPWLGGSQAALHDLRKPSAVARRNTLQ